MANWVLGRPKSLLHYLQWLCSSFYIILIIVFYMTKKTQASEVLTFEIEPQDLTVTEGSPALLRCAGRAKHGTLKNVSPEITWRGPDGQDIGIVGDTYRRQLKNGSLLISAVESNRALTGSYQCLLTVESIGTIVSRSAVVSIAQFPELYQKDEEYVLIAGQTAYFQCVIGNIPSNIEHTIEWHKDDKPVVMDNVRMLLLPNGDLEIDEVNIMDKGQYSCNVTFNEISRQSSKFYLEVKSFNKRTHEIGVAPEFLIKPTSKTAREGETLILNCVANGIPKPSIKWLRNGEELDLSDLDSRFTIKGSGSLQISSVEDTDSGNYQCRASNNIDSLDAEAMVQVYVPPKFIQIPEDKIANEKEELKLECAIYGKPKPMIQWLKNGDIITPNDYMQLIAGHNLLIKGLLQTDAGIFQCVGTNPAGSIQGASQLRIKNADKYRNNLEPPTHKMKSLNSKKEGHHKTHHKKVVNNVEEYKKNNKYQVKSENYLNDFNFDNSYENKSIDNFDISDYDEILPYNNSHLNKNMNMQTYAEGLEQHDTKSLYNNNNFGSSNERQIGSLEPLPLYKMPGAPREVTAQIVKSRFITLSWLEPNENSDDIMSYAVFYKKSKSEREHKIVTKSKYEVQVNIQSLLPGNSYQIRVVANSYLGSGKSSDILEVTTLPEENVVGPPRNLTAFASSHKEIFVSWNVPEVTFGEILKYRVFYAANYMPTELFYDTQSMVALLTDLHPYTDYTINVVAFNNNGMGDSSDEIKVKTFSSLPAEPPNNVTVEVTSSTSITVHWEPPAEEDRNGQITGYKIRYRKLKDSIKSGLQVKSTPANVRFFELSNLDRKSEYQVKIAAMTVNGTGPFTEWYRAVTLENDLDETQVPGRPIWIGIQPGADSIALHWGPPQQQEIKIRNYVLGWGRGIPDENEMELKETERVYILKELEPNAEYVVSLRARNNKGDGPPIYDNIKTKEEDALDIPTPLDVPVGLSAITLSPTSIVVYWIDTSLSKNQRVADNRFYTVRYAISNSNRYRYHNTSDLNCMFNDLKPSTQYEFSVKIVKGRRESTWSMSVFNTTFSQFSITAPRNLTVQTDEQNPHSVLLQWLPPKNSLGNIIGYNILYTTDSAKRDRDWSIQTYTGEETMMIIPNLKPFTTYYFKVQGRGLKSTQNSHFSSLVSYTTGPAVFKQDTSTFMQEIGGETMLYILIAGGTCILLIIVGLISLMCKRKTPTSPDHNKKSYQKNSVGVPKPPDLWINHDQKELKNIDRNLQNSTPLCSDGASSSGMATLPRSIVNNEYELDTPMPTHCATNSLEKCTYVTGYLTTSLNGTMERPHYPRTQYNIPPGSRSHLNIDPGLSQQNLAQQTTAHAHMQTPDHSFVAYESTYCPQIYSNGSNGGGNNATLMADNSKRGHPLKSFSVPGPPPSTGSLHITPAVTIRPQNQSPYKKSSYSAVTPTNRIQGVSSIIHSNDEIQRLAPSTSTEELNQEMANLEGLMKDLSAITANEFEC